jgi:hypothetical protein
MKNLCKFMVLFILINFKNIESEVIGNDDDVTVYYKMNIISKLTLKFHNYKDKSSLNTQIDNKNKEEQKETKLEEALSDVSISLKLMFLNQACFRVLNHYQN